MTEEFALKVARSIILIDKDTNCVKESPRPSFKEAKGSQNILQWIKESLNQS